MVAPGSNTNPKNVARNRCSFRPGMTQIGQRVRALLPAAVLGAAAALLGACAMWGYTVDDAWIPLRYARHIASGVGYRFNSGGPITDGVTPLPWPFLIAPWARLPPLHSLLVTQCFGVALTIIAAIVHSIGVHRVDPIDPFSKRLFAILPALSLPVAAYAVSGMETPMAVLLCAMAAASIERPLVAAAIAGVAATIRPELVPWSLSMALGASFAKRESPKRILVALVLALAPFALESAVRGAIFGSVAPLAVRAKPSDVTHGALYALAGLFVAGVFPLVVAPRALFEKRGGGVGDRRRNLRAHRKCDLRGGRLDGVRAPVRSDRVPHGVCWGSSCEGRRIDMGGSWTSRLERAVGRRDSFWARSQRGRR